MHGYDRGKRMKKRTQEIIIAQVADCTLLIQYAEHMIRLNLEIFLGPRTALSNRKCFNLLHNGSPPGEVAHKPVVFSF